MSVKEHKTETAPLAWDDFELLMSKLTYTAQIGGETSLYRMLIFAGMATYCGLRAGDVLKLRWSDLLDKKSIIVREGKTGKTREIALNQSLQGVIQLSHQIAAPASNNHYIVPSSASCGLKPLSLQYVNRWLKLILERYSVNVQNASSHIFRKTFGRRVFEMNDRSEQALITLSHIFNHSSISITRSYIGLKREHITNLYMGL